MINDFITKTSKGLYCPSGDFYLDPRRAVAVALVSHAHGDHAVPTKGKVFCTRPTKSFMLHRHGLRATTDFSVVTFGEPIFIKDIQITFYPAGHILGSAQILMEADGVRYLYTGDFKTQNDESCESFQFIECDHLITETTFASPTYSHPEPVEEIKNLLKQTDKVVIGAYALGKAQRLTQIITKNFSGVQVFIHKELEPYHMLYEMHGYPTGRWRRFHKSDFEKNTKSVYIIPPSNFRKYPRSNAMKVFATGWKRPFYSCDGVLQVSDHADWNGVLDLISRSKAKKIYTVHGNGQFLKDHFKDKLEVTLIGK